MSSEQRYDILKQEYIALRAEILQSISYQHQILLGGYGASGIYLSYILTKTSKESDYFPALILIPFILYGMTSLWVVECNRMVRASYYIGRVLWRAIRKTVEDSSDEYWHHAEWENWIRSKAGTASLFRERQHRAQSLVVFKGPVVLSLVAALVSIASTLRQDWILTMLPLGCAVTAGWLWWKVRRDLDGISDLGSSPIPDFPVDQFRPLEGSSNGSRLIVTPNNRN
jgi:hypothetical protein